VDILQPMNKVLDYHVKGLRSGIHQSVKCQPIPSTCLEVGRDKQSENNKTCCNYKYDWCSSMMQFKLLATSLSLNRSRFKPRPVHVGFMVDKGYWDRIFSKHFSFLLSVSFHWYSIIIHSFI